MKIKKLSYIILMMLMSSDALSKKLDPKIPEELYCITVGAFGKVILQARDRGMTMKDTRKEMLKIKIIAESDDFQKKIDEIVEFTFITAPDVSGDKLYDFILNDWCLAQVR